ncbi:MAG: hypothetical protein OHK0046_30000 [Anaerolineae bacterium]
MTGYDIKKQVTVSLSAITNASYGTLYPTLHKLLEDGAVDVDEIPQRGRPSKKVYRITQAGRDELASWLRQPAAADQVKREFLLKLYLAKDLSPTFLQALISERRDELERLRHALVEEQADIERPQQAWVMNYALKLCKAEMDWLEQIEAEIGVV